jgi:hypothetical protein
MLLKEKIVVNSQNHTALILVNTMCGQHEKIFHVKEGGVYNFNHCGLNYLKVYAS